MFCSNCGKELNDDAKFCMSCGAQVAGQAQSTPQAQTPQNEPKAEPVQAQPAPQTPPQSEPVQAKPQSAPVYQTTPSPQPMQLGTKWLTVLPFLLGIGAIMNFVNVIKILGSGVSLGDLFSVPTAGPIFALSFFGAIALTALAVVAIVQLVRRKKIGYLCVYALYGCQVVLNAIVFLSMMGYYGVDLTATVIAIIIGGVMLGVNVTYFNKRKHLFS